MATPLAAADAVDTIPAPAPLDTGALTGAPITTRPGRWIDGWNPEDAGQWAPSAGPSPAGTWSCRSSPSSSGSRSGRCGPSWSRSSPARVRAHRRPEFWLIAVPNLVGATLRIPYTFAVPLLRRPQLDDRLGAAAAHPDARRSACVGAATRDSAFCVLLACAAPAGFGGGNFSSSMANISFFYPETEKGFALGLNAAGGNLGIAAVQLAVPLVIVVGARRRSSSAPGCMWIPLIAARGGPAPGATWTA